MIAGEPRAPGGPEQAIHAVAMEKRAAPLRVEGHDCVELLAREVAVGPGAAQPSKSSSSSQVPATHAATICWARMSSGRGGVGVRSSMPLRTQREQRSRLAELVGGQREEASLGDREPRARPADALEEGGDRAGGAHLEDEVDVADVDTQLERGRGHERAQPAGLEPLLGVETPLSGQAPVVARDRVLAEHSVRRAAMRSASSACSRRRASCGARE